LPRRLDLAAATASHTGEGVISTRIGDVETICHPSERATVAAAVRSDPGLAGDLAPLIEGRFGARARELVLASLAARLGHCGDPRGALIPALADALRTARGEFDA
jgi:hypothetical protein